MPGWQTQPCSREGLNPGGQESPLGCPGQGGGTVMVPELPGIWCPSPQGSGCPCSQGSGSQVPRDLIVHDPRVLDPMSPGFWFPSPLGSDYPCPQVSGCPCPQGSGVHVRRVLDLMSPVPTKHSHPFPGIARPHSTVPSRLLGCPGWGENHATLASPALHPTPLS